MRMSGVVMTRTHAHGAPYFVINYDDTSSRTDSVTAGDAAEISTLFLHRSASLPEASSPDLRRVMETVRELEQLVTILPGDEFDISRFLGYVKRVQKAFRSTYSLSLDLSMHGRTQPTGSSDL